MKKNLIRIVLMVLLLLACGSTPAIAGGAGQPPLCYPGDQGCPKSIPVWDGPGFPPLCYPGTPGCSN
jgi:hypothetical protein